MGTPPHTMSACAKSRRHSFAPVLSAFAGGRLFGARLGTGRPWVLALHGWGRTHRDWLAVLEGLDAIALDLPGFGSTPPPDEPWGLEEYARCVAPVLAEMSRPVVIVGHSFGGSVGVHVAANAGPSGVRAVVATGSPLVRAQGPRPRAPLGFRVARWLNRRGIFPDSKMEELRNARGSTDYRAVTGVMRDTLVRVVNQDVAGLLPKLEAPLHLVWGEADADVFVSTAEAAARLAPDATLIRLPGVGHDTPAEAPQELRKVVAGLALEARNGGSRA